VALARVRVLLAQYWAAIVQYRVAITQDWVLIASRAAQVNQPSSRPATSARSNCFCNGASHP
jgi:uncharacterized membrane protein